MLDERKIEGKNISKKIQLLNTCQRLTFLGLSLPCTFMTDRSVRKKTFGLLVLQTEESLEEDVKVLFYFFFLQSTVCSRKIVLFITICCFSSLGLLIDYKSIDI